MPGKIRALSIWLYLGLFIISTYLIMLLIQSHVFLREPRTDYFNYLLDAFFHLRLNVLPPVTYDLSLFQGKWYPNWGPASVMVVLPFYILSGVHANDVVYTFLIGILNILIFYLVTRQFTGFFNLTLSGIKKVCFIAGFAFCSPNLYLSTMEGVWHTEQIIGIFYLLLFLFFYFAFLNHPKRFVFFILSVVFYNLAWLSRYSLAFHGLLFLYPLYLFWRERKKNIMMRATAVLGGVTLFSLCFLFIYNYVRFNNIFETGIHYHKGAMRYRQLSDHLFSISYLPNNIYYYFLHGIDLTANKPYLRTDPEGNSVLEVYPLLLLLFLFLRKKYRNKHGVFLLIAAIVVLITLTLLLCYFATGWMQFGNRFFFDVIPLPFLLTLFIIENFPAKLLVLLILYGIAINIFGIISFDLSLL